MQLSPCTSLFQMEMLKEKFSFPMTNTVNLDEPLGNGDAPAEFLELLAVLLMHTSDICSVSSQCPRL